MSRSKHLTEDELEEAYIENMARKMFFGLKENEVDRERYGEPIYALESDLDLNVYTDGESAYISAAYNVIISDYFPINFLHVEKGSLIHRMFKGIIYATRDHMRVDILEEMKAKLSDKDYSELETACDI